MADKVEKAKKKAKPKKDEKGVLAALPSTRPERIGTRRAAAAKPAATTATAKTATATTSTAPKPSTARKTTAAAKTPSAAKKSSTARKTTTAARRKAAAPRTFEPTQAAESAANAVPLSQTPLAPSEERTYPRPRPVSEGAPGIGAAADARTPASAGRGDERSEAGSQESARPSGVELASTAVKAAGEVAQLSLSIGGHVLKRMVGRLPKP